jgi:hypothetical protein
MDMDSTSPAMALTAVLDVPELLETILSFLPERELITSVQRVSRTWRSSIAQSPRIQRRLFSPKSNQPSALPAWFPTNDPLNLLGRKLPHFDIPMYKGPMTFNDFFKDDTGRHGLKEGADALWLYKGCELCLLDDLKGNREALEREACYMHYFCHKYSAREAPGGQPQPATSDSPELSWRSMQLCNPPIAVAALYVQKRRSAWADPTESCATIFDRAGITMGLVHDTVAAMMRSQFGEKASEVYWSCHVTFGFEVCDEDKPEQDGGEIDREIFPEQDDADSDEMEEDDDEEVESDRDDAEDDDDEGVIRPGRRRR